MSLRYVLSELAAQAAGMVHTRAELFSLEAAEARARLFRFMGLGVAAAICLFMALLVASLTIALYFWPTEHRYLALWLLALLYAVVGGGLIWRLCVVLGSEPAPFSSLVQVLGEDAQALRRPAGAARAPDAGLETEPSTPEEAS
ncbi:MAG TPA: phage holin family protein [Castellaniella sp.]|nr:phage holin family protein [Castellaniella sp.]